MSRLLIVSNRLPVTVKHDGGRVSVAQSSGGLATGLKGPHERSGGLWIGWPGDVSRLSPNQRQELEGSLAALRAAPIHLTPGEVSRYYEGYANGVLWPLFHYLIDRIPLANTDWEAYRKVNERFAEIVQSHYQDGDMIWVHDYQLLLLPRMLRERLPEARIGFFLHIPFPAPEVFRTLPNRGVLLNGLLGADLIGLHTPAYVQHFAGALSQVLGIPSGGDRVEIEGREVRLRAFPMGVDAAAFAELAASPEVLEEVQRIRASLRGQRLLLGIDRLDYTKGIPRRLLAVERLLEREPSLRGKLRFVQISVPSRDKVAAYQQFRSEVEQLAGRINGAHGTVESAPIHYLYRSFSMKQLTALYLAADVMLVTPLRDGMNLVAKEFAASRTDEDGVLVLSELAGAATELSDAMLVNPYDIDETASAIRQALAMPREERRDRMRAMRRRVFEFNVHRWASAYLDALAGGGS
ncbi:MAG TPA: bifunctional alpha,alpha-trehalose-phosphate synthase (UDP-forming)/trehalose-phosphatase [Candidatus Nanopelagicales bacterium]|nr:bifunctional alpha,alpha-trehalose-phosphate synthase (UDP-forming)/trehalose-phosphatase [Candidatus Nanopelagicales bacterium]